MAQLHADEWNSALFNHPRGFKGGGGMQGAAIVFKISLKFIYLSNKLIPRFITLILSLPWAPEGGRRSVLSYSVTVTLQGP